MWFINEWLFKWHLIGKDGPVTIESFDGRGIHYGGIEFSGTARNVYWDTVVRGVRKEITEQFVWVDQEVRKYNRDTAMKAIDESAGLLISFVRGIRKEAVAKDRILRGNGIKFPPEDDAGHWEGTSEKDIARQAEALKAALPHSLESPLLPTRTEQTRRQRASAYWHANQWWLGPLGLLLAIAGVAPAIF